MTLGNMRRENGHPRPDKPMGHAFRRDPSVCTENLNPDVMVVEAVEERM
jgi:hypothetical protein